MHHAEQITNGPIGVGTRFKAETAGMGRPVDMVIEITDYHRPPVPEGTRMEWS